MPGSIRESGLEGKVCRETYSSTATSVLRIVRTKVFACIVD
jgi:hypothetical protein